MGVEMSSIIAKLHAYSKTQNGQKKMLINKIRTIRRMQDPIHTLNLPAKHMAAA